VKEPPPTGPCLVVEGRRYLPLPLPYLTDENRFWPGLRARYLTPVDGSYTRDKPSQRLGEDSKPAESRPRLVTTEL